MPPKKKRKVGRKSRPPKTVVEATATDSPPPVSSPRKVGKNGKPVKKKVAKHKKLTNAEMEAAGRSTGYLAGRPGVTDKEFTDQVNRQYAAQQTSNRKREVNVSNTFKDISTVPPVEHNRVKPINLDGINWERRLRAKEDPVFDLKTYFPNIFIYPFGSGHEDLIWDCEAIIQDGGKQIITCPRRFGKTAICRGSVIRAQKFGMREFIFFVGSKEPKAKQTLQAVKGLWHRNPLLQQDFPEFGYPIYRINGRGGPGCQGQEWKGNRTYIEWNADEMQLPSIMFDKEDIKPYQDHDPDCVIYLPDKGIDLDFYVIRGSGGLCRVAGIDGSIRGEADFHPIFLSQPRPDLVILDDIVRDQKADSPTSSEKLERLVESVIDFLAAPGVSQGILWPGTIIQEGDPTDNYSDRIKHPDWSGKKLSLITTYPDGFDDDTIPQEFDAKKSNSEQKNKPTTDKAAKQGKLWTQYRDILDKSLLEHGTFKTANAFYLERQIDLEYGFEVAWKHMHVQTSKDPDKNEVSTIQHAMNKRFLDHGSFLSEIQNRPKTLASAGSLTLSAAFVREKQTGIEQYALSVDWDILVCFIDVQGEILFYSIFACDHDFNGQFIDYGTFPKLGSRYFRKSATYGWRLLSKLFYQGASESERYAGTERLRDKTSAGHKHQEAPTEARIYNGLKLFCDELLAREFSILGTEQTKQIMAIGIDTKYESDTVKKFVREYNKPNIVKNYNGAPFGPGTRQLEEYEPEAGCLLHHQLHPHVKDSRWRIKPYEKSQIRQNYILSDVNRGKSFLMRRLATPVGSRDGCITLYHAAPSHHRMWSDHVATSEFPVKKDARGIWKDMWESRPAEINDNDYLDCGVGSLQLASICGASIKTPDHQPIVQEKPKTLREMYEARKKRKEKED